MKRWPTCAVLVGICLMLSPQPCSALLRYVPGEGWYFNLFGEPDWLRPNAVEQLKFAEEAFEKGNHSLALRAARRTVTKWFAATNAPQAQLLVARCHEALGRDEKAFKAYQQLIERYPTMENFDEVVQHQFAIANRFLAGKRFRFLGYIPLFPSMDRTIAMYEQIIKTGPFSDVAPQAQMNVAEAHLRKKALGLFRAPDYPAAGEAYGVAAYRYSDRPAGANALYRQAEVFTKQASKADYDQSVAGQAITAFTDFMILHPNEPRVAEAQETINALKSEQARGSLNIAKFYEKRNRWWGALVYYNDVQLKAPGSPYADQAQRRIEAIMKVVPPADLVAPGSDEARRRIGAIMQGRPW